LFSAQCSFASTIQSMAIRIFTNRALDLTDPENKVEIVAEHLQQHWHFPFPVLQTFSFTWPVSHYWNNLMTGRLMKNCPLLQSIWLDFLPPQQGEDNNGCYTPLNLFRQQLNGEGKWKLL